MVLEDWKTKLAVLWIIGDLAAIVGINVEFY
jgi:hypothetical protein